MQQARSAQTPLTMEENILPSLSSARNTQRKVNFDLGPDHRSAIGAVNNFERPYLHEPNSGETKSSKPATIAKDGAESFGVTSNGGLPLVVDPLLPQQTES